MLVDVVFSSLQQVDLEKERLPFISSLCLDKQDPDCPERLAQLNATVQLRDCNVSHCVSAVHACYDFREKPGEFETCRKSIGRK